MTSFIRNFLGILVVMACSVSAYSRTCAAPITKYTLNKDFDPNRHSALIVESENFYAGFKVIKHLAGLKPPADELAIYVEDSGCLGWPSLNSGKALVLVGYTENGRAYLIGRDGLVFAPYAKVDGQELLKIKTQYLSNYDTIHSSQSEAVELTEFLRWMNATSERHITGLDCQLYLQRYVKDPFDTDKYRYDSGVQSTEFFPLNNKSSIRGTISVKPERAWKDGSRKSLSFRLSSTIEEHIGLVKIESFSGDKDYEKYDDDYIQDYLDRNFSDKEYSVTDYLLYNVARGVRYKLQASDSSRYYLSLGCRTRKEYGFL